MNTEEQNKKYLDCLKQSIIFYNNAIDTIQETDDNVVHHFKMVPAPDKENLNDNYFIQMGNLSFNKIIEKVTSNFINMEEDLKDNVEQTKPWVGYKRKIN